MHKKSFRIVLDRNLTMATKPKRVTYDDAIDDNADYLVPLQEEPQPSRSTRPKSSEKVNSLPPPGGVYGSLYYLISVLLYAGVPIAQFVIGLIYINRCTVQQFIPIYMILSGIFGIAFFIVGLVIYKTVIQDLSSSTYLGTRRRPAAMRYLHPIFILLLLFVIGWWIAGQVVVFQVKLRVDLINVDLPEYCHVHLYKAAYILIFVDYLLAFIVIILMIMYRKFPPDDIEEIEKKKRSRSSTRHSRK